MTSNNPLPGFGTPVGPAGIPRILHFCFGMARDFGGKPWSLVHHACVQSAIVRINPSATYFYYEHEPRGPWWRLTREMVTTVKIRAPRTIFGNQLLHPAHRADIVRLEKLLEFGGIYLDCDVFVHRDFGELLQNSVVLGQQGEGEGEGLCNAVICAEPQAPFLGRWYAEYKTFRSKGRDAYWDEHSVKIPLRLSKEFPEEITVLPPFAFFWPTYKREGLESIFSSGEPISTPVSYANHLWEAGDAWERFLADLTPGQVRRVDSNFHFWARPMVASLPDNYGAPFIITSIIKKFLKKARRGVGRLKRTLLSRLHWLVRSRPR